MWPCACRRRRSSPTSWDRPPRTGWARRTNSRSSFLPGHRWRLGPGSGRGTDGYVADVLQGLDMVLLSLHDQFVLHAVLPVQEIAGGSLKTSAQGDQQAVVHVACGVATLGG